MSFHMLNQYLVIFRIEIKYKIIKMFLCFQKLLEALQVSHPKIDEIIRVSSSLGLHAKLTGAGGGGFAYILLPPHLKLEIVEQAKDLVSYWSTTILRLEIFEIFE